MKDLLIKAEALQYRLGRSYILKDIEWQVCSGENWLIFGMNGCGKTTLLSILAGFRSPSFGNIYILGEKYSSENIFKLRSRCGFVSSAFFDRYFRKESALDIVLSGKCGGFGSYCFLKDKDIRWAKELLANLVAPEKISVPYDLLSRGQRQNVLVARALFAKPEILLLDEPCTGLDLIGRSKLLHIVRYLAERGVTIVYVTHYVEEILDVFTHTLLLKKGRIFDMGKMEEIWTQAKLSRFLGEKIDLQTEANNYRLQIITEAKDYQKFQGGERNERDR